MCVAYTTGVRWYLLSRTCSRDAAAPVQVDENHTHGVAPGKRHGSVGGSTALANWTLGRRPIRTLAERWPVQRGTCDAG